VTLGETALMSIGLGESPFRPGFRPAPPPPAQGIWPVIIVSAVIGALTVSCCCGGILLPLSLVRIQRSVERSIERSLPPDPIQLAPVPRAPPNRPPQDMAKRVPNSPPNERGRIATTPQKRSNDSQKQQDEIKEKMERSRQESRERLDELRRRSQERMRRMSDDMKRRREENLKKLDELWDQSRPPGR
jgi:hypothetical protein